MNFYGGTTHKEVNNIDQLKIKLQRYLTEHNLTALKFAMIAQINPIKIYCWMNDDTEHKNQVNHKNENPLDNRAVNLEWCTAEYNSNYGTRNERISKALKLKTA